MTLFLHVGPNNPPPRLQTVTAGEVTVAWDPASPWVDVHDDGDVLSVIDGRLHPHTPGETAREIHARFRASGTSFAAGLLGDFVAVVVDRTRERVMVARDPLGVRPWYMASAGRRHGGSDDIAAVAALDWVDTDLDERWALEHLAALSRSVGPTPYSGIQTLAPGHTWVAEGRATSIRHHEWRFAPDLNVTWEEAAERCRETIEHAVADRMLEPVTCELSGGLDSSTIVGTAVRLGARGLLAARLLFETPNADERTYSDAVLRHWNLKAVSERPWVPERDEALELTARIRRPLPDPQFTMFLGLHGSLRNLGRLESLTGLGGDDAFVTAPGASLLLSGIQMRRPAAVAELMRSAGWTRAWSGVLKPALHQLAWWRHDRLPMWIRPEAAARAGLRGLFRSRPRRVTGIDGIDQRLGNIVSGYDAGILESRAVVNDLVGRRETHPFLDPRFIAITYGLDPSWPSRRGHVRALQLEAFSDRLPGPVRDRNSKAEFSEVFWPQVLDNRVLDSIRSGPLVDNGWLDVAGFDDLVERARAHPPNLAIPLARCVSLNQWLTTR